MSVHSNQKYYGDDRDLLEEIYPTCTSFVRTSIPATAERSVEVAFDPTKEAEKKLFAFLCYAYEDSYDWESVPLAFRRSDLGEIIWRKNGAVVRKSSLADGVKQFDQFTDEMKTA